MRVFIPWLLSFVVCPSITSAGTWYVSPTGSDDAAGTLDAPFATIPRAQRAAEPGDTVYLRGGTYRMTEANLVRRRGLFARLIVLDKSGLPGKPITYAAMPNERPIFDCSDVKPPGQRVTAFYVSGSWLQLSGIEVTGVQVTIKTHTQSICFESQGSHNVFERIAMHDGQAIGLYHVNGRDNLFLNCDAWSNWDRTSENGKGGNVDGFGCHPTRGSTGNIFRGCRAWFNSDDGFDCISAHEAVTFEHCWAMKNGLAADGSKLADGNGFKAGGYGSLPARGLPDPIPRHVVRHCVAVGNKNSGFYANHHPGGCDWLNNTGDRNGINFNMLGRLADNRTDVDGSGHRLLNNLSLRSRFDLARMNTAEGELTANSFTLGLKLKPADLISWQEDELFRPRSSDGSLPNIDYLHPANGSVINNAGVDCGLPFNGPRPDIGAFESDP